MLIDFSNDYDYRTSGSKVLASNIEMTSLEQNHFGNICEVQEYQPNIGDEWHRAGDLIDGVIDFPDDEMESKFQSLFSMARRKTQAWYRQCVEADACNMPEFFEMVYMAGVVAGAEMQKK